MVTLSFGTLSGNRSRGKRWLLRLVLWLSRLKGATLKCGSSLSSEENSVCYNSLIGKVTTPSVLTLSGLANFFSDYFRRVLFALPSHRNSAMKRTVRELYLKEGLYAQLGKTQRRLLAMGGSEIQTRLQNRDWMLPNRCDDERQPWKDGLIGGIQGAPISHLTYPPWRTVALEMAIIKRLGPRGFHSQVVLFPQKSFSLFQKKSRFMSVGSY